MKFNGLHLSYLHIYLTLLSTTCVKIHQVPYIIFETIKSFFTTQLVYITLGQMLQTFDKNIPSKCKFSDFSLLKLKFIKFLMLFFKQKVSFSLNFGSLFNVMKDNSSVLFQVKRIIWTKGAHQSAKFQTFDCTCKISPNLYFDRLLKLYKILAEKYRWFISYDPEDWCKSWRKTFKNDKNMVKLDLSPCKSPKLVFSFGSIVQSI